MGIRKFTNAGNRKGKGNSPTHSRRQFIALTGVGVAASIAGCTGSLSDDAVVSMTTSLDDSETVDLEGGTAYELVVSLDDGDYVSGSANPSDAPDDQHLIELEEEGEDSLEFVAEESEEYWVALTVSPEGGEASLTLREVDS